MGAVAGGRAVGWRLWGAVGVGWGCGGVAVGWGCGGGWWLWDGVGGRLVGVWKAVKILFMI